MVEEARNQKLINRIDKLLENYEISNEIIYTVQEKKGIYQCVIDYKKNGKRDLFWVSTGLKVEKGNLRNAKNKARDIADFFKERVKDYKENKKENKMKITDFQELARLNTTNYSNDIKTKADWDFYEYMEYWLKNIIKNSVEQDTYNGYKRNVKNWIKKYFTMEEHKKTVKEITADDLDDFYDYCRENNLKNSSIDHYNDNISSAYNYLLKKGIVKYNPTKQINPIVVEVVEVSTYNKQEILKLLNILKDDVIELPTLFDSYYGLRRSEIIGLRKEVFDFEANNFIINHVAIQNDGKEHIEKVYFKDKTKSKKGYRSLPLFPEIKDAVLKKLDRIEENKKIFGNEYNHKYDGYICVQDNGDLIQPNFFTKRFGKIIKRNNLRKITPHGLRHSIATLLHLEGVDIRDLQDWLGHESISSTNRYTRSDFQKQISTGKTVRKMFEENNDNQSTNKTRRFVVKKKNTYVSP